MITHRLPSDNYREAVDLFLNKGEHDVIKIVFTHES